MTKKDKRILGINPGTRYLGLAVFCGSELLDWRVKTFRGKWRKEKAGKIIKIMNDYIELYNINTISLKKCHPSRASKNLNLLVLRIKALARRKKIKVYQYSIKELEKLFLDNEKLNGKNLAEKIVSEYPVLIYDFQREKSNRNSYYLKGLEAVALGAIIR